MEAIPQEVRERVNWHAGAKKIPDDRVRFFLKSQWSRGEAWNQCPLPAPPSNYNPWRKCHTEHYWVWYCTTEVPPERPKKDTLPVECRARMEELHRRADRLFEMFINGNRNDVAQELLHMEPKAALAVLTVMMIATNEEARTSISRYFTEVA